MGDLRQIVRRDSRCPWADFLQRVRAGLIGAVLILIIAGAIRCLT